jgi:hypothetical protein
VALLEDPRDTHHHQLDVIAGVDVRVLTGRAIKFSRFDVEGRSAHGTVVTVSDGKPLATGRVLVRAGSGKTPTIKATYQEVKLTNGSFSTRITAPGEWVDAYCLPSPGFGDCSSAQVKLK